MSRVWASKTPYISKISRLKNKFFASFISLDHPLIFQNITAKNTLFESCINVEDLYNSKISKLKNKFFASFISLDHPLIFQNITAKNTLFESCISVEDLYNSMISKLKINFCVVYKPRPPSYILQYKPLSIQHLSRV